jgi:hypothetical protein
VAVSPACHVYQFSDDVLCRSRLARADFRGGGATVRSINAHTGDLLGQAGVQDTGVSRTRPNISSGSSWSGRKPTVSSSKTTGGLDAELRRRLWALYDAAKVIRYHPDDATDVEWSAFYRAVADIPESQHGR